MSGFLDIMQMERKDIKTKIDFVHKEMEKEEKEEE